MISDEECFPLAAGSTDKKILHEREAIQVQKDSPAERFASPEYRQKSIEKS